MRTRLFTGIEELQGHRQSGLLRTSNQLHSRELSGSTLTIFGYQVKGEKFRSISSQRENLSSQTYVVFREKMDLSLAVEIPVRASTTSEIGNLITPQANSERDTAKASPANTLELKNYQNQSLTTSDTLHKKAVKDGLGCTGALCKGSLVAGFDGSVVKEQSDILLEAEDFLSQYYNQIPEKYNKVLHSKRWAEVKQSIQQAGVYEQTVGELAFGAKTAWRNSARCIGRIQWSRLQAFDARKINNISGMFSAICDHLKFATNNGNIRSAITIFGARGSMDAATRIWNSQFIRYAGYENSDGTILGDPASVELTKVCLHLGWRVNGERTRFDILPLVLSAGDNNPGFLPLPKDLVVEVPLVHPRFSKFNDLLLRWYAVPAVSNMGFNCGGIYYPTCGFNGWYQSTEIVRNLCDVQRYNLLKEIASSFGLDTSQPSVFWKDIALAELNCAVVYSYQAQNVTIVDQYSASESFMAHLKNEQKLRGGCPADWVWVVPPLGSAATGVFHQEMLNYKLLPSYEYQPEPWKDHQWKKESNPQRTKKLNFRHIITLVKTFSKMMLARLTKRVQCTILYATETGKSETLANALLTIFKKSFRAQMYQMDEYDYHALEHESLLLVVTSTFGNGQPPENGKTFHDVLKRLRDTKVGEKALNEGAANDKWSSVSSGPAYAVFGLGSRAYPNFCAFAATVDGLLEEIGCRRLMNLTKGDEMGGQEESFYSWLKDVHEAASKEFCLTDFKYASSDLSKPKEKIGWNSRDYKLVRVTDEKVAKRSDALTQLHRKQLLELTVLKVDDLRDSSDRMIRVCFKTPPDCSYSPGDHLAIFPENEDCLVQAVLKRTQFDFDDNSINSDTSAQLQFLKEMPEGNTTWKSVERVPECSLRTALTHYLDFTSPPTTIILAALATCATDPSEQQMLKELSSNVEKYEQWRDACCPSIVDLLDMFPSLIVRATLLLSLLPILQPRYYSVSSSADVHPGEVHLTVGVVRRSMSNQGGSPAKIILGVCSNWLHSLQSGTPVLGFIRQNRSFHLPSCHSTPIIMVGPGSGISPFRAFWQQREYYIQKSDKRLGEAHLYYGCRTSADMVYKEELAHSCEFGALTSSYLALSREPHQPKAYVQDEIRRNAGHVYDILCINNGHLYICGDITMANDLMETIINIFKLHGNVSAGEARKVVEKIKGEGRIHEDIFGLTLRSSAETAKQKNLEVGIVDWKEPAGAAPQ